MVKLAIARFPNNSVTFGNMGLSHLTYIAIYIIRQQNVSHLVPQIARLRRG
jgi:hypothetical protein